MISHLNLLENPTATRNTFASFAEPLRNAESLEVNAVDHVDVTQSPEAVARIHESWERVAAGGSVAEGRGAGPH
jgi:hypothetical protein